MVKNKFFLLIFIYAISCNAQQKQDWIQFVGSQNMFKKIDGYFTWDGDSTKSLYEYYFKNKNYKIKYFFPMLKDSANNNCGYFNILGNRFNIKRKFEHNIACQLDPTYMDVYYAIFNKKKYILITSINDGSGLTSSKVICNLFDITKTSSIKYYSLWSMFGGEQCFGDFNKDGKLDFLKIQNWVDGKKYRSIISVMSLINGSFQAEKGSRHYIIFEYNKEFKPRLLVKNWFN